MLIVSRERSPYDRNPMLSCCPKNWLQLPVLCEPDERTVVPVQVCPYCRNCRELTPDQILIDKFWELSEMIRDIGWGRFVYLHEPETTEAKEIRSKFDGLFAMAGQRLFVYKNCGCVASKLAEFNYWTDAVYRTLKYCGGDRGRPVPKAEQNLIDLMNDYRYPLLIKATESKQRRRACCKRNSNIDLAFFQTTQLASNITKILCKP